MLVLTDRSVDLVRGVVLAPGGELKLTTKETQLLGHLSARPGVVVSREELLAEVWGYQPQALTRAVDNMMKKLRAKVEADPAAPRHLVTVFGEGYRFDPVQDTPVQTLPRTTVLPPRSVVGREALVLQARAWLRQGRRCLLLVGPAGMGKSTMARQIAAEEADERPGGAWWCAPGETDAAGLRRSVSSALGSTEAGLLHALEASELLLVLDGIDALSPEACGELESWLALAPGLDVVATSRRVRLAGVATVVEVPPLELAPARQLLESHAARVRPGRPLLEEEVDLLLAPLQGWPLAIELAAARLRALSAREVAERLPSPGFLRDPSGAGSSLQAALRASVEALDPEARQVFAECAVFCGGFSAADAEGICEAPDVVDALHRLVDHSLLRSQEGRLSYLDAVHTVAASFLQEQGRVEPLRARHLAWFVSLAEQTRRPPVDRHWQRLRSEWDNLFEAHRFALEFAPESAARLALVLQRELSLRAHHLHRQQILRQTLAKLAAEPAASPSLLLQLRQGLLNARAELGENVVDETEPLVAQAEGLEDAELWATMLLTRAQLLRRAGRLAEVESLARRAIDLAPTDAAPYVRIWARLALAGTLLDQGRADEAIATFANAGHVAREVGDRQGEGQALWGRAMLEVVRGKPQAAEPHLYEALQRCPGEPRVRLDVQLILAQVAVGKGQTARAREICEQIRSEVLRQGEPSREGILYSITAELQMAERDWTAAEATLRRHIALCAHNPHQGIYASGNLGMMLRLAGRNAQALEHLLRVREQGELCGARRFVLDLTPEIAAALADLDDIPRAQAELEGLTEEGPGLLVARAHLALAQLRQGDAAALDRARTLRATLASILEPSVGLKAALRRLSEVFLESEAR